MNTQDKRKMTEAARRGLAIKTARKYEAKYAAGLRLLGWTVIPPSDSEKPDQS